MNKYCRISTYKIMDYLITRIFHIGFLVLHHLNFIKQHGFQPPAPHVAFVCCVLSKNLFLLTLIAQTTSFTSGLHFFRKCPKPKTLVITRGLGRKWTLFVQKYWFRKSPPTPIVGSFDQVQVLIESFPPITGEMDAHSNCICWSRAPLFFRRKTYWLPRATVDFIFSSFFPDRNSSCSRVENNFRFATKNSV